MKKNPFLAHKKGYKLGTFTPLLASFLMENFYGNVRDESPEQIEKLTSAANNGTLVADNDCICFEIHTGIILNGHHRLKAVIRSGKTVQLGVGVGMTRSAAYAMDTGKKRDNGTCIAVANGYGKEVNSIWKKRASVANMCIRSVNNFKLKDLPDNKQKENFYLLNQAAMDAAMKSGTNKKTNGRGFRAAMTLFFLKDFVRAQQFHALVTSLGEDIKIGSAANALMMYFESYRRGQGGESTRMTKDFRATQMAIEAYQKHDSLNRDDLTIFF